MKSSRSPQEVLSHYNDERFFVLAFKYLDATISSAENDELQQRLKVDAHCRDAFVALLIQFQQVSDVGKGSLLDHVLDDSQEHVLDNQVLDFDMALNLLAQDEKNAPAVEIEISKPEKAPVKVLKIEKSPRVINKFSLYSAILYIAALVFVLVYVQIAPPPAASVAMISDSVGAEWANSDYPAAIGDRLWNNEGGRWLHKGTVKIEFDYGAEVIIESPANFELVSPDKMILHSGRLFASVPDRATGFTVHTPNSTVIDLGTEFGVKVDFDGRTDVHMFKGKASLVPGANGDKQSSLELLAGEAKAVTQSGQVQEIPLKNRDFVCGMNSKAGIIWRGEDMNLADIVGGGNGFGTGRQGYGVHLETGQVTPPRTIAYLKKLGVPGVIAADTLDFVDCVFVPDGGNGDVEISTTGILFSGCPDTGGYSWGDPLNGGVMRHTGREARQLEIMLDGTVYGTKERTAIYMHGNLGITFDLEAIRRAIPEAEMTHFTALCGISQTVVDDPSFGFNQDDKPIADMWVLVDGQTKFSSFGMKIGSAPNKIHVPLTAIDRFLTLVVTDSDGDNGFDWGIFAEPVIHFMETWNSEIDK